MSRSAANGKGEDGNLAVTSRPPLAKGIMRSKSLKVKDHKLVSWAVQGVHRSLLDDFAHVCLEMHWSRLLPFVVAVYMVWSFFFASLLYVTDGGDGIGGDIPSDMHAFEVCLWFSTVNLVTAGFGALVPSGRYAYIVSTAAHLIGLLLNSLLLGIVVAKASVPTAKMIFSNVVCVRTRNNVQHLMVRVGNARGNMLFSPDIRFAYVRAVKTEEGEEFFQDVQLQVKVPVSLQPIFMITHAITKDSPLYGKTEQEVNQESGFFVLIVSAAEVETGQALYSKKMFFMKDFRFNQSFVDVVSVNSRSFPMVQNSADAVEFGMRQRRTIEFRKFHDTKPLEDSHRQLQDKAYFFGSLESSGEDEGGLHDVSSEPNSPRPLQPVDALQTLRSPNTALQDRQTMHPVHPSSSNSSSIGGSVREAAAALISTQAKLQLSNSPNSMKGLPTSDIKGEALRGNPPHGGLPLGDSQQRPRPIGQSSSLKSSASGTTGNIGLRKRGHQSTGALSVSSIPEASPLPKIWMDRTSSEPVLSVLPEALQPIHSQAPQPKRWSFDESAGNEQLPRDWIYRSGPQHQSEAQAASKEPSFDYWSQARA